MANNFKKVPLTDVEEINKADIADFNEADYPNITEGAGAPSSIPIKVGDIYIDTTGDDAYIAVGTASSSDWEKSESAGGGGDLWSDPVNSDIVPDTTQTRDIGSPTNIFATIRAVDYIGNTFLGPDDQFMLSDSNSNEMAIFTGGIASAVNYPLFSNSATGDPVLIKPEGDDTNISLNLVPKGTGEIQVNGNEIYHATGTDVPVTDGGTGASTAAGARTNLGVDVTKATNFLTKAITIESPTDAESISMFFTDDAITVTQLNAVLRGSSTPSVTWTVRHATDRNATGSEVVTSGTTTTSTTTGSEVTSFNDATIPAGSFVWFETSANSGTVDEINVIIEFTKD